MQGGFDNLPLEAVNRCGQRFDRQARSRARKVANRVLPYRCGCNLGREVLRANPLARTAERHEALDLITKLTDIARPPMLREQLERIGREKHVRLRRAAPKFRA